MATSIREQILQAIGNTLADVAGVNGAVFTRSPRDPLPQPHAPTLLLYPETDTAADPKNLVVDRTLTVTVAAVASQTGRSSAVPPELQADALLVAAHAALKTSPKMLALAGVQIKDTDTDWELQTLNVASAYMPARYAISYRTTADDIATQG